MYTPNILGEEVLENNLDIFYEIIEKYIVGGRKDKLISMYKDLEDRLALAPSSTNIDYNNSFIGGYLDHVLRVVKFSINYSKFIGNNGLIADYTDEELVFSALNHNLGKLGSRDKELYIPNESKWHVENQGKVYDYNPKLAFMPISDRSLMLLNQYGVDVSENEYYGIKLYNGLYEEDNKKYFFDTSSRGLPTILPFVIHHASVMAIRHERQHRYEDIKSEIDSMINGVDKRVKQRYNKKRDYKMSGSVVNALKGITDDN